MRPLSFAVDFETRHTGPGLPIQGLRQINLKWNICKQDAFSRLNSLRKSFLMDIPGSLPGPRFAYAIPISKRKINE